MKNISIFQVILLSAFGIFLMGGLATVAIYSSQSKKSTANTVSISIWGTYSASVVRPVIEQALGRNKAVSISYSQRSFNTFDTDLAEALAVGKGPDIILVRQDLLLANLNKLTPISYETYPVRDFRDQFLEIGEVFLSAGGIYAIPFAVDPLVMYWHRDIFSRAGLVNPPLFWDEIYALSGQLTQKDASGAITQSGIALGTYDNIQNAKGVLSLLFLQSGSAIVNWNSERSRVEATLSRPSGAAQNALSFYTQFADARKGIVSWSRALQSSESMFLSNRLAVYFGLASEARTLKAKSPNLNFDVAQVPQNRSTRTQLTYGDVYGFGILRSSSNASVARTVINSLTSAKSVELVSTLTGLPPVRRDVNLRNVKDPFYPVFVQASLVSRSWLDPKKSVSDPIFRDMIESILSGFVIPLQAIGDAETALSRALPRI